MEIRSKLEDYEIDEWNKMVRYAEEQLDGSCPLLEDQVIISIDNRLKFLEGQIERLQNQICLFTQIRQGGCIGTP